jgi:hypothetical protein
MIQDSSPLTEATMSEQTSPAAALLAAIRDASKDARLKPISELQKVLDLQTAGIEAGPSHSPGVLPTVADAAPVNLESLIAEAAEDDIKLMRGTKDTYYFSDNHITEAYALHLFRVAERDPARMVADTVRDESRIYPRPTPAYLFLQPPFNMTEAQLDGVLWQISQRNDMTDIRSTTVSNGALYLYSTEYLTVLHAETMAEWNEVGQAENP